MPKITCPYGWCNAILNASHTGPSPAKALGSLWKLVIPQHTIEHHLLGGPCPASLMYYPISPGSREAEVLGEAHRWDQRRIDLILEHDLHNDPPANSGVSQSLRGPHRIGREPPPKSKDWALKGRADEDIQPDAKFHQPPPGVHGQGVGKVSVQETASALQGAAIRLNEAHGVAADAIIQLQGAHAAVEEARQMVQVAKGDVDSETLNYYVGLCLGAESNLEHASELLEHVPGQISAALEKGETYLRAIHS